MGMPGEEVTDCYGLHHLSTLKEERAPAIQKGFLFTCTCQACEENWPPLHQLRPRVAVSNTWRSCGRLGSDLLIGTMRLQAWPCPAAFGPNFNNDDSQRFLTEDQVDHKQRCIVVH